jgi:hypothetical protein
MTRLQQQEVAIRRQIIGNRLRIIMCTDQNTTQIAQQAQIYAYNN